MGSNLYRQLREILLNHRCVFVRQGKGSHEIWRSPISGKHFTVPVTIVSRFLANSILKQAGIKKSI